MTKVFFSDCLKELSSQKAPCFNEKRQQKKSFRTETIIHFFMRAFFAQSRQCFLSTAPDKAAVSSCTGYDQAIKNISQIQLQKVCSIRGKQLNIHNLTHAESKNISCTQSFHCFAVFSSHFGPSKASQFFFSLFVSVSTVGQKTNKIENENADREKGKIQINEMTKTVLLSISTD